MEKKQRNSQIELARIIALVLIVFHHMAGHGYGVMSSSYLIDTSVSITEINNIIMLKSFGWPGKLAVGIFMMITAWFAYSKDGQPNWKKIISVWATLFFYNTILCLILLFIGKLDSFVDFLPVFTRANWYVNGYLMLLVFMPFLMAGLDKLTRKNHFILCVVFLIVDMLPWRWDDSFWAFKTYVPIDSIEMMLIVVITQYIKKYSPKFFEHKKTCVGICLGCIIFITAFYFAVFKIGLAKGIDQVKLNTIANYTSCLFPIMSITLFMGLKDVNIGSVKSINCISSLALGTYLFHDNIHFRRTMWDFLLPYMPSLDSSTGSILLTGLVLSVLFFATAAVFELIRRPLFTFIFRAKDKKINDKKELSEEELKTVDGGLRHYIRNYCPNCKKRVTPCLDECPYCGQSL